MNFGNPIEDKDAHAKQNRAAAVALFSSIGQTFSNFVLLLFGFSSFAFTAAALTASNRNLEFVIDSLRVQLFGILACANSEVAAIRFETAIGISCDKVLGVCVFALVVINFLAFGKNLLTPYISLTGHAIIGTAIGYVGIELCCSY